MHLCRQFFNKDDVEGPILMSDDDEIGGILDVNDILSAMATLMLTPEYMNL